MKTYIFKNDLVETITINIEAASIHDAYRLFIWTFSSFFGYTLINPD